MKRREFLKKTGRATALAAVTGGTGFLFHNRVVATFEPAIVVKNSFGVPRDPKLPTLAIARDEDHIAALLKSLDAVGGIKRFVKPGETVTIKPSVGWDRTPEQAANTNPILVAEMVRQSLDAGAARVIVTDITCNDPRRCFIRSGIRVAAEEAGAEVLLPSDDDMITVAMNQKFLTDWPVLKHFIRTDRIINMPIVKQHSLSSCTIGMKNLFGIIGGQRNQLHQEIDQSIVDLATFCVPTLTVIDATRVLMQGGPQGGSLDYVAKEDSVICTTDQVAGDARAAEFLGLAPDKVGHIVLAEKSGLGQLDYMAAGMVEVT